MKFSRFLVLSISLLIAYWGAGYEFGVGVLFTKTEDMGTIGVRDGGIGVGGTNTPCSIKLAEGAQVKILSPGCKVIIPVKSVISGLI